MSTTTDTTERPALNLEPSEASTPISEEAARDFISKLRDTGQERPAIRALADHWGWHRSRVARFLSRIDAETPPANRPPVSETQAETPSYYERLIARPAPSGDVTWVQEAIEDGSVLIHEQPFTVIYFNNADQVVIRQKGDPFEEDAIVLIAPEFLDRLIARLIECRDKGV